MERRPTALLAPVITRMPPGNSLASIVLPESRDRGSLTSSRSTCALFDQRIDALLRVALGHFDGGLNRQHRAGRLVDDVTDPVIAALGAADLRAFHQDDGLDRRRRREAVHDLAQVRRAVRAPRPGLGRRPLRQAFGTGPPTPRP